MAQGDRIDGHSVLDNASATVPNNLPQCDRKFTGRGDELADIHDRLDRERLVGIVQVSSLHPQGGLGKTSLAISYAWQHLDDYPGGLFFVDASDGNALARDVARLAEVLGIESNANELKTAEAVVNKLSDGRPALVILDGLDQPDTWHRAQDLGFKARGSCNCLVTINQPLPNEFYTYVIDALPLEQSVQLLGAFRPDALQPENEQPVGEITSWLNGCPTALTFAGGMMALNPPVSWAEGRDHLKKLGFGAQQFDSVQVANCLIDEFYCSLNLQQRAAIEFATLLPKHNIVTNWLRQLIESDEVTQLARRHECSVVEGEKVISVLLSLQILRPQAPGYKLLTLPSLARSRMNEHYWNNLFQVRTANAQVLGFTANRISAAGVAVTNTKFRSELTPLVEHAKELPKRRKTTAGAKYASTLSHSLHRLGRFIESKSLLDVFLDDQVVARLQPPRVAALLADQAVTMLGLDDLEAARTLMERAVAIERENLAPDDPTLAKHYSNLAGILKSLGQLDEARRLFKQAIEIEEKQFSADHPKLGLRHWWLGDIERDDGQTDRALEEYQHALDILRKHYPPEHSYIQRLTNSIEGITGSANESSTADSSSTPATTSPKTSSTPAAAPKRLNLDEAFTKFDDSDDAPVVEDLDVLALQAELFVTGQELTNVSKESINEKIREFHRRFRSLKVFHTYIDQPPEEPSSVKIQVWGTRALDRGKLEDVDPDYVASSSDDRVLAAVDEALEGIERSMHPEKQEEEVVFRKKQSRLIPLVAGALVVLAMLASVIVYAMNQEVVIEEGPIEKQFRTQMEEFGLDPDKQTVFIPLDMANEWYLVATGDSVSNSNLIRKLDAQKGAFLHLDPTLVKKQGFGFVWRATDGTVDYSLRELGQ